MTNNKSNHARVSFFAAAAASALFAFAPITSAFAQTAAPELRWRAFAGCWVPEANTAIGANATTGTMVCIAPVAGTQSADVATIVNKQVLHTDRLNASGEHIAKTVDKCPGWESATWSEDRNRLLLRSQFDCGDSIKVKGSGVFSVDADGNFVQVQGTSVGANGGARVVHYRPADVMLAQGTVLTDSAMVQTVATEPSASAAWIRQAAGRAPSVGAVLDLSKHVDEAVAQAWLSEFGKPEKLSAKDLVAMSDAGMPSSLIDMMVAMTYPERFQLQARNANNAEARPVNANAAMMNRAASCYDEFDRFGYLYGSRLGRMDCYRYGVPSGYYGTYPFGYGLGYGLGYGYGGYGNTYYGNSPIVIVTRGDGGGAAQPRGRAVVGGGYTRERTSGDDGSSAPRTSGSGSSGTGSSSSTSGAGTFSPASSSSSSGSSGGEERTAKPRTPPPLN